MKKMAFPGFMASMMAASGAAFADSAALTTQDYVNAGLRAVYKTVKTDMEGKQDSLSVAQLNAANSGITADKVTSYDNVASAVNDAETGLAAKANAANVYTKAEIDSLTESFLTSGDVAVYSAADNGGIAVSADHKISIDIEEPTTDAMYVYKNGRWTALSVQPTFPQNFDFEEEEEDDNNDFGG